MGNVLPKKGKRGATQPAAKALAGVHLQTLVPKGRIVYGSASAASEVPNLGHASRLGLCGEGSAFAKPADFIGPLRRGGGGELGSCQMKAAGSYLARSLSFDGVTSALWQQFDNLLVGPSGFSLARTMICRSRSISWPAGRPGERC